MDEDRTVWPGAEPGRRRREAQGAAGARRSEVLVPYPSEPLRWANTSSLLSGLGSPMNLTKLASYGLGEDCGNDGVDCSEGLMEKPQSEAPLWLLPPSAVAV